MCVPSKQQLLAVVRERLNERYSRHLRVLLGGAAELLLGRARIGPTANLARPPRRLLAFDPQQRIEAT